MAKKHNKDNREKRPTSRLEAASELTPDLKNCSSGNCLSKGPCKTNNCK